VAESLAPDAVVIEVARRHVVRANLLHRWRLQARAGAGGRTGFLPVTVAREQRRSGHGIIEIELDGVARVRVDGSVEEEAPRRVLRVLGR
jgi:transposase